MFGTIIGDLAGSIYEYKQSKKVSLVSVDSLIHKDAFFSDDTILTVAILDAIVNGKKYSNTLKEYGKKFSDYRPNFYPYFKNTFSKGFTNWINGDYIGKSNGNGALMRISPVGFMFKSEDEVIENAINATIPSHNTHEAISYATLLSLIIFYARNNLSKDEIIKKCKLDIRYVPFTKFNVSCKETFNNCIYAAFTSNSLEETLKKVISYGGDTDTNAAIAGAVAEALYGIDFKIIEEAKKKIPVEFSNLLTIGYNLIGGY